MRRLLAATLHLPPVRFAAEVARLYFARRVSRSAAGLAYFLILTVFPILICVSAFVGELEADARLLLDAAEFLPEGVKLLVEEYLRYTEETRTEGMLAVGVVMTLFFASAAVRGLMNVMAEIYEQTTFRGLRQIAASVFFSVLLLVTVYASLAVMVTGRWLFRLLGNVPGLERLAEGVGVWQWGKYVLLLALVFAFVLLLYRFTAPLKAPRPPVLAGALGAAVALVAASAAFSWFVDQSARYPLVYGSLASVIILLVWLYLCGNVLILGSIVNFVLDRKNRP